MTARAEERGRLLRPAVRTATVSGGRQLPRGKSARGKIASNPDLDLATCGWKHSDGLCWADRLRVTAVRCPWRTRRSSWTNCPATKASQVTSHDRQAGRTVLGDGG